MGPCVRGTTSVIVGWAKRSVPTVVQHRRGNGGHGADAPLPTLRGLRSIETERHWLYYNMTVVSRTLPLIRKLRCEPFSWRYFLLCLPPGSVALSRTLS